MKRHNTPTQDHDMESIADDAKALVAATADVAEQKVIEARERLSAALDRGRVAWSQVQDRAKEGVQATDRAIRDNPYRALGVAFGLGALAAFLIRRR